MAGRNAGLILLAVFLAAGTASAGFREIFEKEFMAKPWTGETLEEESACIGCHASQPATREVPQKWRRTVHYENNVSCHDCHGGDPKDPSLAMSHQRGFVGVPKPGEIPEFCGKCHLGILRNYLESGHGRALKLKGTGPHCVTCHGSHKEQRYIQRASIAIINEGLCSRCHTYERARTMKQALLVVEQKMEKADAGLAELQHAGFFVEQERKTFYSTQAEFRALFHSIDVELVKAQADEFSHRLSVLDGRISAIFEEMRFRKNFSTFLFLLFSGLCIVTYLLSQPPKD